MSKLSLLNYRIVNPRTEKALDYSAIGMNSKQKRNMMGKCCWRASNDYVESHVGIYVIRKSVLYQKFHLCQGGSRILDICFGSCILQDDPADVTDWKTVVVRRKKAFRKLDKCLAAYERGESLDDCLFMPW